MKALLLLSVLLSGILAITAAAVEAPEPVKVVEAAPQELQEISHMGENEGGVVVPEDPEMVSTGEITSQAEGRYSSCPFGWNGYKKACYRFESSSKSWGSAMAHCASQGALLASAHDAFEYSFLQDLTRRAGHSYAWLGGFSFQGWWWADMSPIPNYSSSYPCIYLHTGGQWSSTSCGNGWAFICTMKLNGC